MASKYFTASLLEVFNGDVALAGDVNSVSSAAEAGFDIVLQDFASITVDINNAVTYSNEWATKAEDSLISVAAGGDGVTDYSSLHHAAKASADAVLTAADVVLTHADVVLTHADVVLTNADALATAADKVATNADVLITNADAATTTQDALDTAADVVSTNADVVLTHADVVLTHADEALTNADALATAADKVATNADVLLTAADVVLTNADVVSTNADAASTAVDAATTAADVVTVTGIYDSFDDRYLGDKAADPTLDNNGNALLTGAIYFNSTIPVWKGYDGAAWISLPASVASAITNTPAGNIASTNVQAAINELDTEKYGAENILGVVSQVAGIPTGALMEYGSNANGEYWKYAGGMMICKRTASYSITVSTNNDYIYTLPAAFISLPNVQMSLADNTASQIGSNALIISNIGESTPTTTTGRVRIYSTGGNFVADGTWLVNILATGRWF